MTLLGLEAGTYGDPVTSMSTTMPVMMAPGRMSRI